MCPFAELGTLTGSGGHSIAFPPAIGI
jgi:hypothetical protein